MSVTVEKRSDRLRAGVTSGRPEAAAAIWGWREASRRRGPRPTRGKALRQAGIQAAVAGAIALALWQFGIGHAVLPVVIASIAGAVLLLALVSPAGHAALDRAVMAAATWVGHALTWLLMVPLFFVFFLPFGLLFRRGARDPMERELRPDATSYWRERTRQEADPSSYEKQF